MKVKFFLSTPSRRMVGVEVQPHSFLTSALDVGEWSNSRPGRFTLGEKTSVPIEYEVEWTPKSVWTFWKIKKNTLSLPGFEPRCFQPVPH
jgi:hypothetical protein